MDAVVDAVVAGLIAAGHARVGGVDDGVANEGRDVPLPKVDARLHGRQVPEPGDAFLPRYLLQVFVLYPQKLLPDPAGHADVEQAPQKLSLFRFVGGYCDSPILRLLVQQRTDQILPSFRLIHEITS